MKSRNHTNSSTSADNKLQNLERALSRANIGYWTWRPDGSMDWDTTTQEHLGIEITDQSRSVTDLLMHIQDNEHEGLLDALEASSLQQQAFDQIVTTTKGNPLRLTGHADTTHGQAQSSITGICLKENTQAGSTAETPTSTLEDFFDHSKVLMAELDLEGTFLRANAAWGNFLGIDNQHLIGRSLLNYLHPDNLPNTKVWLKQLVQRQHIPNIRPTAQGELSAQIHIRGKGNREISWTWTADLTTKRIFTITRDITETYQDEAELTKELTQAHQSNTELESFASTASHDLREPLRMISSYLKLLQERYPEALDNRGRRYIDYASEGANRMRTLIDDLLAYSRIDKASNQHEAVALEDVIANAIDNLAVAIRQSKAEITVDINDAPIAWGDPIRLTRLFQNLLGNAIKFQETNQLPVVNVSFNNGDDAQMPGKHIIAIKDNGIGIDPDHKDLLFHLFQRLNTRDDFEGSGIGLSVCKKIAEQHGGKIWFRSSPKEGSTFYVSLNKTKNDIL